MMGTFYSTLHQKSFYTGLFLMASLPILATEAPRIIAFLPVICLIFFLSNLTRENFRPIKSDLTVFGFFTAFFVFLILHTLFFSISPDAAERLTKVMPIILGGVLFLYLIRRMPEFNHEKFYKILMMMCALAASILVFEITQDAQIYRALRGLDADVVVYDAVFNRGTIAVVSIFLMTFFLSTNKKNILTAVCFVPILALIFFADTQTTQIGFVFGLLFFCLFPWKYKIFWWALYVAICFYLLAFPFTVSMIYETVPAEAWKTGFLQKGHAGVRIEIWDFIARKIQENPWQGFGLEFTKGYEDFDARKILTQRDSVLHPHNLSLQFWIETGLVGVLFLKVAIGLCFAHLYHLKCDIAKKAGLTMLVTFIVLNSFSYGFWQSWWIGLMFVISGLILLVSSQRNDIKNT